MSKIYLSELSLKRTLASEQLALTELPDFIRGHGYDGLELFDRRLAGVERSESAGVRPGLRRERLRLRLRCQL